jgi:uncharacterized protein DUF3352
MPLFLRLGLICALLLSGCSLLPSVSGEPEFQASALVGADTWFFNDITLRPSIEQTLRAKEVMDLFETPAADAGADLHHVPTPSGRVVDFERDVLPHLDGEISLALSGSADDPQPVVVAHTNDIEGMLRLFAEEAQPKLTRDARGVTRYDAPSGDTFVAGYKNWLIYTATPDLREQVLDRIDGKGTPNLSSDERYHSVVGRLSGDRLGFGYVNLARLSDRLSQDDARLTGAAQVRGRMAYSFGFDRGPRAGLNVLGIRLEYSPDNPISSPVAGRADSLQAMDRLPKASMLAFAGSDLSAYSGSLSSLGTGEELPVELQALLSAFDGPYAMGITKPAPVPGAINQSSVGDNVNSLIGGLFLIAKPSPDADLDQIMQAVDAAFDAAADDDPAAGAWEHDVVTDNDWLAINAVPPPTSLADVPEDLLASDEVYQWVRSGFVQYGSNVYVNLQAVEDAFGSDFFSSDEMELARVFRAIGISAQTESRGDTHAHMTVLISSE